MPIIARGQITVAIVEDGADGQDGQDGAAGPSMVYRGAFSSATVYYNNLLRRDVVKHNSAYYAYLGADCSSGVWNAAAWESVGTQFDSIATSLLLAENAEIGGFIFKGGKLISQRGTLNGQESTDYANSDFVPYITLDGSNGEATIFNGEFYGGQRTLFHSLSDTTAISLGDECYKISDKLNLAVGAGTFHPINVVLPNDTDYIGSVVKVYNPFFALTTLPFFFTTIVRAEEGSIFYSPKLGQTSDFMAGHDINAVAQIEFIAGVLEFLGVPGQPTPNARLRWVCINYPQTGTTSSGGGITTTGSGDVTASGTLSSNYAITGGGNKMVKSSGYLIETSLSGNAPYLPTSAAVKNYVDLKVADIDTPSQTTEWYNIYTTRIEGILHTVIKNYVPALTVTNTYRLVLLKFRHHSGKGRRWCMPMFSYEMYNQGVAQEQQQNAIAENNSWWRITGSVTRWFNATNAYLASVVSTAAIQRGGHWMWKNTRNKKMPVGVAIYKHTEVGKIGWQRVSNIAYVELFKTDTNNGTFLITVRQ